MATTTSLLTFEEFERLPDQPGKRELLKGELIELPPSTKKNNKIAERIFLRLLSELAEAHSRGEARELGEACMEMGYQLDSHSWLQPDASVTHANQPEGEYVEGAPAIAIEVVSPSYSAEALETMTDLHFQFGDREVWVFYPKTRRVFIHVPGSSRLVGADEAVTTPLLPGFSMLVSEIFGE